MKTTTVSGKQKALLRCSAQDQGCGVEFNLTTCQTGQSSLLVLLRFAPRLAFAAIPAQQT